MADNASKCLRDDRNVCELCGTLENLSLCGGCRKTWYCCKEHQKADWKEHKKQCDAKGKTKEKNSMQSSKALSKAVDQSNGDKSRKRSTDTERCDLSTNCDVSEVAKAHVPSVNKSSEDVNHTDKCNAAQDSSNTETDSSGNSEQVPQVGSSEDYVLQTAASSISQRVGSAKGGEDAMKQNPLDSSETYVTVLKSRFMELARYVTECLTKYGICVVDSFLGESKGLEILSEVKLLYRTGVFKNGQVVDSGTTSSTARIRGDMITWVDGAEDNCENILFLISCMDDVILQCTGLEHYKISERTKAMVACYPGNDTGYVRHVDNPNGDGRCVTCIYYLNKDWDVKKHGGLLRIFPEGNNKVANIEPVFDRLLFFWSDRRNPHEVQSSGRERYAITVWYYDTDERAEALKKFKGPKNGKKSAVPLINGDKS